MNKENTIKAFNFNVFLSDGIPNKDSKNVLKNIALSSNCKIFNEFTIEEGVEVLILLDGFPFELNKKYLPKSLIYIGVQDIVYPLTGESISESIKYLCFDGYSHKITKDIFNNDNNNVKSIGFGKLSEPIDPNEIPKSIKTIQYYLNHNHPLINIPTPLETLIISDTQHPLESDSFSTNNRGNSLIKKLIYNDGYKFMINQELLPPVKEVVLGSIYHPIDNNFKNSKIDYLYFKDNYPFPIKSKTIPINLKKLKIGNIKHSLNGSNSIPNDLNKNCEIILNGYDLKLRNFNLPLNNSMLVLSGTTLLYPNSIPFSIKTLIFEDYQCQFKKSNAIPKTVYELEFGKNKFSFKNEFIPSSIKSITFRASFNHNIKSDMIPPRVSKLGLFDYGERDHNHLELNIPITIKQLILCGFNFDNIEIDNLIHQGLESLVIKDCIGNLNKQLPSSIKYLFLFNFTQEINQTWLPPNLIKLSLGSIQIPLSKQSFENQNSLKHLILYDSFNQYPFSKDILPNNIKIQNKEKYLI